MTNPMWVPGRKPSYRPASGAGGEQTLIDPHPTLPLHLGLLLSAVNGRGRERFP
jgi:hypothetical protein